ncbi:DUF6351 family protein [Nonomuraea ceibae]|uniref:DUF6351 family protein n=1 Tax=Nonomuraea ceibae TaxID=1935170 RepID=UPI001C5F149D|nr:DUF6351 family protein [Nonomuraea ceibae]
MSSRTRLRSAVVALLTTVLLAAGQLTAPPLSARTTVQHSAQTSDLECAGHRAMGATVTASSTFSSSYGAKNAVDGLCAESSRWMSSTADATPTLTITFPAGTRVGTVGVYSGSGWPSPFADTVLVDFTVEARTDDGWVTIGTAADNTDPVVTFSTDLVTDTLRLVITEKSRHSTNAARLYELVVRAPGEGPPTPRPTATDDFRAVTAGTELVADAPGVLGNDIFPDGVTPAVTAWSAPAHGSLTTSPDGSFRYKPGRGYVGIDTFTYQVGDDAERSTATVTITVTAGPDGPEPDELRISTVSGRPDMVSGGDALLRIELPRPVPRESLRVTVNGQADVTPAFRTGAETSELLGLVTGLREGENTVEVAGRTPGGPRASITLVNHPAQGPVFSGLHQQPFACETAAFAIPVIGGRLGEPLDANCTIAPRADYFYRTTANAYKRWPAGATAYPSDLATTTNSLGVTVKFIVRMETATANRAVVQMSMLHDPLAEPAPSPTTRPAGWNGRAVFTLGGGCAGGWYRSGTGTGTVTDAFMLGRGFALMSSSLNVFGNNCNDVTAAETAMMAKELFVEKHGPVEHTIGYGCSGGSYQAHQIADNYPGVFDGIVVGCSFPEVGVGTVNFLTDARLLDTYFTAGATVAWTEEQKRRASGFATAAMVSAMSRGANRIDPRLDCGMVPEQHRYNPVSNPAGVRCGVYDHMINVYGADPATGFARRPLDNVGIQYGLGALKDGAITPEQFLDLNARVGGLDADANVVPRRTEADPKATKIAYRTGRVISGGRGLARTPIIDYRSYWDDVSWGDIHVRYHTFSLRERLKEANGTTANHVSLLEDARYGLFSTESPLVRHAVTQMDHWLTNLAGLRPGGKPIARITAARPGTLVEGCNTRDEQPRFVAETLERDPASYCERLYPTASFPREVAGEDVTADIITCRLTEPKRDGYGVQWTNEQWERLRTIFPRGVCDYTRPGVSQQRTKNTWHRF